MNPHPSRPSLSFRYLALALLDRLEVLLVQLDQPALPARERRVLRRQGLQAVQDLRDLVLSRAPPDPRDAPDRQDR